MNKMSERPEFYVSLWVLSIVIFGNLLILFFFGPVRPYIIGFTLGCIFGLLMFLSLCRSFTNAMKPNVVNAELKIRAGYSFRLFAKFVFLIFIAIFIKNSIIFAVIGLLIPQIVIYLNQFIIFMRGLK